MAKIIQVNFKEKRIIKSSSKRFSLKEVKAFLGAELFEQAFLCPTSELNRWVNHPEAILTGASEAYETILNYRYYRQKKNTNLRLVSNLG